MQRYDIEMIGGWSTDYEMCKDPYGDWVRFEDVEAAIAAEREEIVRHLRDKAAEHGAREERTAKWTLLDAASDIALSRHHRTLQEAEAQETDVVDS